MNKFDHGKVKTPTGIIELGGWKIIDGYMMLRTDSLAFDYTPGYLVASLLFNNAAGFIIKNSTPIFFGSDFSFFIEEWHSLNGILTFDIEKNKQIIDNFLSLYY